MLFEKKSVYILEEIRAAIRGESICILEEIRAAVRGQSVFWKRFVLLFRMKSVFVLEEIQAVVRGEISPCFGRDSGCCLG